MKFGVIGGGLCGLAAAYELAKQGHQVVLWEKERELGGQAATFNLGGQRLERFYHHLFASDIDIVNFLEEAGLRQKLHWYSSRVGFYYGEKLYDFVTPGDLLRFSPLNFWERLRLGVISLYLQRQRKWQKFEGVTARDWLVKYGGQHAFEVVWGPLLRSKFGSRAEEIGMVWLWARMYVRLGSRSWRRQEERLGYIRGSFGLLIDTLAERIREMGGTIYTNSPVRRVFVEGSRAAGVEFGSPPQSLSVEAVIATVPSPIFLKLVPELFQMPGGYAARLEQTSYLAASCLVLTLKRSFSPFYWLNISAPDTPFVAVVEHTNLLPTEDYGGRRVVYVSAYLSPESPYYPLEAEELLARYLPFLQQINPGFDRSWVEEVFCFREEAGQPVVTAGYQKKIPEHRTPIRGLYLANTTQIYPEDRGMNYSFRLGRKVAALAGKLEEEKKVD